MKYWCFQDGFGLDNLVALQRETPQPGPGEVLLEMAAASLNYRDLVVMRGEHGKAVQPPLIPLSDGVGTVVAVGKGVVDFDIGDRASPLFLQHWMGGAPPANLEVGRLGGPLDGVLASHCIFPAAGLIMPPGHLSDAQAATLPCAGVTAWSALSEPDPLRPGETVLIQGSGGVALMALALARAAGARVLMTTSSPAKADRLTALGADAVINRNATPSWAYAVREATGGAGCDRVLELGGAATFNESLKAVRTGGTVILIGNVTGSTAEFFLPLALTRRLRLCAVSVGSKQDFTKLNGAIDLHRIEPVVDGVFDYDDAPEAFRALDQGGHFGNICIACR